MQAEAADAESLRGFRFAVTAVSRRRTSAEDGDSLT
jgi:hypothetical protein